MKVARLNTQNGNVFEGNAAMIMADAIVTSLQNWLRWIYLQFLRLRRIELPGFVKKLINIRIIKIHLVEECY
jgi:hypothetical protein